MGNVADPTQRELIRQITARWEHARQQLEQLREAVRKQGALAQAKLESAHLRREIDLAYRGLGEVVWAEIKRGAVKLPSNCDAALKRVQKADADQKVYASQVHDLLLEGSEAVDRQRETKNLRPPVKTGLAPRPKKR